MLQTMALVIGTKAPEWEQNHHVASRRWELSSLPQAEHCDFEEAVLGLLVGVGCSARCVPVSWPSSHPPEWKSYEVLVVALAASSSPARRGASVRSTPRSSQETIAKKGH